MLIQINDLTKTYQHHDGLIHAVDHVSFDIEKGSFVTITGASGSGKTTLLLLMGGLLQPTTGKMTFDGKEINLYNDKVLAEYRSKHVGFVMQSFALIPYLTAFENLTIALNIKIKDNKVQKKRANDLLEWVGLNDRATHYPRELSAGQQQRVAIARALANNPTLLLADEPTGNLDPGLSEEILNVLKTINQEHQTTVVMVTHSPLAAEYGKTKIRLQNGKLNNLDFAKNIINEKILLN